MTYPVQDSTPPRWLTPWLAALPPVYVLSPLALLALPHLRRLPRPIWWVLTFYALSQQLPALFSPEPFLASGLALIRTGLLFGLIGVGAALGNARGLQALAPGLAVVYLTALGYSVLGGTDVFTGRLTHPYMTPITLGISGVFGVWLALFGHGSWRWRVPLGLLALGILLLSGSRGPLAAAVVGCAAGFAAQRGRLLALALVVGAGLLAGGVLLGERLGVGAITRLGSGDTTGRDFIWHNTLTVIQTHPWSGVGSYRLGHYLSTPGEPCSLFVDLGGTAGVCPSWLESLGNPWLIAHNITMQQLAETGPLGLVGLFFLLASAVFIGPWHGRPIEAAIMAGLLVATVNDNTLLVPSPFFAELFWVVVGLRLLPAPQTAPGVRAALLSVPLLTALSLPLVVLTVGENRPRPTRLLFLAADRHPASAKAYSVFAQYRLPPGDYRLFLNACTAACRPVASISFSATSPTSPLLNLQGDIEPAKRQRAELLLKPRSGLLTSERPLRSSWQVEINE